MTNYEGYPNFDPFGRYFNKNYWERPSTKLLTCNLKTLKPILAQIVTQHSKKSFLKSQFHSFVIKQCGNSRSWGENFTGLCSWKSILLFDQLETDSCENNDITLFFCVVKQCYEQFLDWNCWVVTSSAGKIWNQFRTAYFTGKNEDKSLGDMKYTVFLANIGHL